MKKVKFKLDFERQVGNNLLDEYSLDRSDVKKQLGMFHGGVCQKL